MSEGEVEAQRIRFLRRNSATEVSSRNLPHFGHAARTRSREEALATKMRAVWPAAAVAKIAEDGLKQLDSLCYECGDDAKENDGLQQVVRSALADVD